MQDIAHAKNFLLKNEAVFACNKENLSFSMTLSG